MPPEALEGRADARSDVYSLGITLYEMLALRPAFDERDRGKLLKLLSGDGPTHLMKVVPDIPRDLATIIHKAIDRESSNRYPSPSEFAADLRLFLEDRPIRARQANALEQLGRWGRRNPAVASLISVSACLLVALLAISAIGNYRLSRTLKNSQDNLERALRAERESRLREADALVGKAEGFRLSQQEGQRIAALAAIDQAANIGRELKQPADWFAKLRNEAIAALALPDLYVSKYWAGFPKGTRDIAASGNLKRYARLNDQGVLSVRNVEGDREIGVAHLDPASAYLNFNFDGTFLSCYRVMQPSSVLQFWKVTDAGLTEVFQVEVGPTDRRIVPEFLESTQGNVAIVPNPSGFIAVVDLDEAKQIRSLEPIVPTTFPEIRVHPSRPLIAIYSYFVNSVVIRNYETGEVVLIENPPWDGGSTAAWHPSGRMLCISKSDSGTCRVYGFEETSKNLTYQRSMPVGHGHPQITFNTIGDRYFATGWASYISMGNFWTGQTLFTSRTGSYGIAGDDTQIGLGRTNAHEKSVGPFSVAEGKELLVFKPSSKLEKNICYDLAVHPNGRILVVHFSDGIHFLELESGRELALVESPNTEMTFTFDRRGSLCVNSYAGNYRVPFKPHQDDPDHWVVGPPERLPFHAGTRQIESSADGTVIAQPMYAGYGMAEFAGGWIAYCDQPLRWVAQKDSVSQCSVSLDGRWVAFHNKVFEASSGKMVFERKDEILRFSSNGKWLLGGGRFSHVYEIETWKERFDLGEGNVFDCLLDGSVAVQIMSAGDKFRLVELETGQELARLSAPYRVLGACEVTLDGNRLAFQSDEKVCVWDLRRLRARLDEIGLNWKLASESANSHQVTAKASIQNPVQHNNLTLELVDLNLLFDPLQHATVERKQLWQRTLADPWNSDHYVALGNNWMKQCSFENAFWAYSAAIALGTDAHVHEYRAEAAYRTDHWDFLVDDIDRCLSASDTPEEWRLRRALARRCLGQYERAIGDLNECILASPKSVRLHYYRADTWAKLGKTTEASADFAMASSLASTTPTNVNYLVWKLITGPRSQWLPERAYEIARKAYETLESQSTFLNTMGVASYRVEKYNEALEVLERNVAKGTGDAFDYYVIAMCYAKLGNAAQAETMLAEAEKWHKANFHKINETWRVELQEFRNEAMHLMESQRP